MLSLGSSEQEPEGRNPGSVSLCTGHSGSGVSEHGDMGCDIWGKMSGREEDHQGDIKLHFGFHSFPITSAIAKGDL